MRTIERTDSEVTITVNVVEGPGYLPAATSPSVFVLVHRAELPNRHQMVFVVKHPYDHVYFRKTFQ